MSTDDSSDEERAFLPRDVRPEDELEYDEESYIVYRQASLGPPCLSFDIIPQDGKFDFPLSVTCVAGTQAAKGEDNSVIVFSMSNLHPTSNNEKEEDFFGEEEESGDEEEKPQLKMAAIKHDGGVNRVRYTSIGPTPVAAAWSETGVVSLYDLTCLQKRNGETTTAIQSAQQFHLEEGFALDWSRTVTGVLASGDCNKNIHVLVPQQGGGWLISRVPDTSHTASVEDIKWSPNEKNWMASCSCDRTIKIWDVREKKTCKLTVGQAHFSDINVIDWNPNPTVPLLVSGGDDGMVKMWDLRRVKNSCGECQPIAEFKHHQGPVTSVEWHRDDSTVFASSGEDHQVALWDLAIERDEEEGEGGGNDELKDLPPQLLFIHQGLKDVKEIHWHPGVPGLVMATSHTGFDVFKTISV